MAINIRPKKASIIGPDLMESPVRSIGVGEPSPWPPSQPHMIWIAPSEKDTTTATLAKRLWDAADPFPANTGLKSRKYFAPVNGITLDQDTCGCN